MTLKYPRIEKDTKSIANLWSHREFLHFRMTLGIFMHFTFWSRIHFFLYSNSTRTQLVNWKVKLKGKLCLMAFYLKRLLRKSLVKLKVKPSSGWRMKYLHSYPMLFIICNWRRNFSTIFIKEVWFKTVFQIEERLAVEFNKLDRLDYWIWFYESINGAGKVVK